MQPVKSILIALSVAGLLLPGCAEKKKNEIVKPVDAPAVPMAGGDADEHGCRASAGYQWSSLKKTCVRAFELPLQLLNPDKTSGAGVVFSADQKQAEVFSAIATVVLTAQSPTLFSGTSGSTTWYLEQKNGKWRFGTKGEATPTYTEQ